VYQVGLLGIELNLCAEDQLNIGYDSGLGVVDLAGVLVHYWLAYFFDFLDDVQQANIPVLPKFR
jgi:hypothetical protein